MLELLFHGVDIEKFVGNTFYLVLGMIAFDVLTGILASAKEKKINSSINFDGLIRKAGVLTGLAFVSFVDVFFQADGVVIRLGVTALIVYEGMSIIENFSRIGINLNFLTKYFDPNKVGKGEGKDGK